MLSIPLVLLIVTFVSGQVIFLGSCPNITPVQNFEAPRYLGKWYEIEKYFAYFEYGGKCVTANYSLNSNGSISVLNTQVDEITQSSSSITGQATFVGSPTEAKLSVIFPSLPVRFAAPYWVIGTNYKDYAVVWSCFQLGIINARNVWILTRARVPTNETLHNAYAVLDRNHISKAFLMKTNQENCSAE